MRKGDYVFDPTSCTVLPVASILREMAEAGTLNQECLTVDELISQIGSEDEPEQITECLEIYTNNRVFRLERSM